MSRYSLEAGPGSGLWDPRATPPGLSCWRNNLSGPWPPGSEAGVQSAHNKPEKPSGCLEPGALFPPSPALGGSSQGPCVPAHLPAHRAGSQLSKRCECRQAQNRPAGDTAAPLLSFFLGGGGSGGGSPLQAWGWGTHSSTPSRRGSERGRQPDTWAGWPVGSTHPGQPCLGPAKRPHEPGVSCPSRRRTWG